MIGSNTMISGETKIIAQKSICIGNDCIISWDSQIMDTDFHSIYEKDGIKKEQSSEIVVSDHVWIGSRCNILKGSHIPSDSIIASGSTIIGKLVLRACIYTGLPIRILKKNVEWKR